MNKTHILATLLATLSTAQAVTISNFGADISADLTGLWTSDYTSGTSRLDSSIGPGNSISDFSGPAISSIAGQHLLELSAQVFTSPSAQFDVRIYDGEGDFITSSFNWDEFVGAAPVTVTKTLSSNPSFDATTITGWQLLPSGVSGSLDVQFGSLSAVPEPSTYAALAGLLALGFVMVRRRA